MTTIPVDPSLLFGINDGSSDNILYSVSAVNNPNPESVIAMTTNFADGTITVSENVTNPALEIEDPIVIISTPEPGTLNSLLVLGCAVTGWKRLRKK